MATVLFYLPTYLFTYLPTCLPACPSACPPIYLATYLPACIHHTHPPLAPFLSNLPICPTYLPYLPALPSLFISHPPPALPAGVSSLVDPVRPDRSGKRSGRFMSCDPDVLPIFLTVGTIEYILTL